MKKSTTLKLLLMGAFCFQVLTLSAQKFQGIATYHSASKMQFQFADEHGQNQITDEMQKQFNKQMQKEYTLTFNLTESTWKEVESLDGGGVTMGSSGGTMVMTMGSSNGIMYKNSAEARYEQEANVFGKPFLIKDQLTSYEWQLTGNTKKIGNYNCQEAVYQQISERRAFTFATKDQAPEERQMETFKDTVNITAWFTPEIPVSHGPDDYWGLPGLILEVNNGRTTLVCSKVVLNPEDGIELKMPSKGQVVTREEYQKIHDDKAEEMMKKYSGGGGKTFRIGSGG